MVFPGIECDAAQRRILAASEHLFLTPEEQVNFHFMIHQRNLLKSANFMESWEAELLASKLESLRGRFPEPDGLDYTKSCIRLPQYAASEMSSERFQSMLRDPDVPPIVIKGFISDSEAVRRWNHRYLMESFGKVEIMALQFDDSGSYQAARENGESGLTLRQIIAAQLAGSAKERYYVNNSAQIFVDHPELYADIQAQKVTDLFRGHSVNTFTQLFVGNVRTWGTNWHQGNDLSCALMISGTKRWYFLDPRLVYILRPYLNGPNGMMTKGEVRYALDFQLLQSPLYAYAPKFVVDLEAGDALVFTKYWPHAVINVSPFQIMANMRMTELDLESLRKGHSTANLLPVFDNVLNSDPEFIKFKFAVFKSLGKLSKEVGDDAYFGGYAVVRK
jgi:hypothetical protein